MEDDCRKVGEDLPSRCDVVLFSGFMIAVCACSGGSIIVIDAEEGGEGGEWKSEWWRLTGVSALDGKNQCYVFSGVVCRNLARVRVEPRPRQSRWREMHDLRRWRTKAYRVMEGGGGGEGKK